MDSLKSRSRFTVGAMEMEEEPESEYDLENMAEEFNEKDFTAMMRFSDTGGKTKKVMKQSIKNNHNQDRRECSSSEDDSEEGTFFNFG
jgi:hypothetical protein